jgi:phage terminase Nu1 subunit (DNA packaging protein)
VKVNRTELAEILGISMPTVTAWMGDTPPLPYVEGGGKGRPFVFDTTEVLPWWAENKFKRRRETVETDPFSEDAPESYDQADRRKMVANADRAELELAKSAGKVVEIEDVAAVIAEMHVRVRTRLLGIGNKVRVGVSAYFGGDKAAEEKIVTTVEEVITDALAEIRDDPFGEEEAGDPDESA